METNNAKALERAVVRLDRDEPGVGANQVETFARLLASSAGQSRRCILQWKVRTYDLPPFLSIHTRVPPKLNLQTSTPPFSLYTHESLLNETYKHLPNLSEYTINTSHG